MSIEEAKNVTTSFGGTSFVPPPRTIDDITAVLDREKLQGVEAADKTRAIADQALPATADRQLLANFLYRRALAARGLGRGRQEIDDLTLAAGYLDDLSPDLGYRILNELSRAEWAFGNSFRALEYKVIARNRLPANRRRGYYPLANYCDSSRLHATRGELDDARALLEECSANLQEAIRGGFLPSSDLFWGEHLVAIAEAQLMLVQGQLKAAELAYRRAISALSRDPKYAHDMIWHRASLAGVMRLQGRVVEAEIEARAALLAMLRLQGKYSASTGFMVSPLAAALAAQGRYAEAEKLHREVIEIYQGVGLDAASDGFANARQSIGRTLAAQGRWQEAVAEFEAARIGVGPEFEKFQASRAAFVARDLSWALALIKTGQSDRALELLEPALAQSERLFGATHPTTARIRGLVAMARSRRGERREALRGFAEAVKPLSTSPSRDEHRRAILEEYVAVLADVRGTPLESEIGGQAVTAAFRLVDVARGASVQRALDASATRAAARDPRLSEIVRNEQDARQQTTALETLLAAALAEPVDRQNATAIGALRERIIALRRALEVLTAEVRKGFPEYGQLMNPTPPTVEQARAALRPGEAWLVTYTSEDRTYVWAIPQRGPMAFTVAPLGEVRLASMVEKLRRALDPSVTTAGEIPAFDVGLAHELYRVLLEPVRAGWERAETLLVVAHGPLGQLPLTLLPIRSTTLGAEREPLFSGYRDVPWLVRTHTVVTLPSVSAHLTLRSLPPGDPGRRPFVGFGNPYFSEEQARRAATRSSGAADVTPLERRGVRLTVRSSPKIQDSNSSRLATLPPLPETADEIRSIALAMHADLTRDIFLGERANEQAVRTLELSGYRVVAFATHGLVPGDLDGLTQPALALSAPEVTKLAGDGLLTMEEILALRLNADWVVLSACNTASGQGAGAEAISGLGRAFFYAGARALLVSNWPVETTSARTLTTDLFRRQAANPKLTRAQALQQTLNALIDSGGYVDPQTKQTVFSYAHPIFWAPFALVGDGGGTTP